MMSSSPRIRAALARRYHPAKIPPQFKKRSKLNALPKSFQKGTYRRNDYKQVWYQGRSQGAHVVAWKKKYGDNSIPKGWVVHHKKHNKLHDNPSVKDLGIMPHSAHAKESGGLRHSDYSVLSKP